MGSWTTEQAYREYLMNRWGSGYFTIGPSGNVLVHPDADPDSPHVIDMFKLVQDLEEGGLKLPLLLRFNGIVASQVDRLNRAFASAIKDEDFQNRYRLAFPVKVNQQRHVIESVLAAGEQHQIALEVGSKPELVAMLAIHDSPDAVLLCNGYKDREYIELALSAKKLNRRPIIIVEQYYELDTILEASRRYNIEAEIGFRMKPLSQGAGKWQASGGEQAKFGLTATEIVCAIQELKKHDSLHLVSLLHFHIGSQVSSIVAFKRVLREACRMYVELKKLVPSLSMLDVGGGLGVDYDGSGSDDDYSTDYSMEEYARGVVSAVATACNEEGVEHPEILSESGRAVLAHHAVLITSVNDVTKTAAPVTLDPDRRSHRLVQLLHKKLHEITPEKFKEALHDSIAAYEELTGSFLSGDINLEDRAIAESLYQNILGRVREISGSSGLSDEEIGIANKVPTEIYFCNFSLFQSIPDAWAIDQLFPVMPIHRLHEKPARRAVVADLTCDSDGIIKRFINSEDVRPYLHLHDFHSRQPYLLGFFLLGAYQEILGDIHNLFGDTNAVHVSLDAEGEIVISDVVEGDTIREILAYVRCEAPLLIQKHRTALQRAIKSSMITSEESALLAEQFKRSLDGYTYPGK